MRVLLISTYEQGHQPLALASPARRLVDAGHEVQALDTSVQSLPTDQLAWADRVAVSVPMHTALRLALPIVTEIRRSYPSTPVALYGLYAGVGARAGYPVDAAITGEYESRLAAWVADPAPGVFTDVSVHEFRAPLREILPPANRYATLETASGVKKVGYVEASHGCRHTCRHCPVPTVYEGRYRIVDSVAVLDDIDALVSQGVEHVTFGDPDFWNGPAHAMRVLESAHASHPDLTYDVTIKVEHLIRHNALLPRLAAAGVLFVVSAFESTSAIVLDRLDKGHTPADLHQALSLCREVGVEIHPTWLPFTPWTSLSDAAAIFEFLSSHDLFGVTEPVQLGLRLLVPPGSLALDLTDVEWGSFDPSALSHRWLNPDPRVEDLQSAMAAVAATGTDDERLGILTSMWRIALEAAGRDPSAAQIAPGEVRARITEPWFC